MNAPCIRFPQFNQDWTLNRLSDVADINPRSKKRPAIFDYIDLESVTDGKLYGCQKITDSAAPSRAQRVLKKDDILYQTVRPYQRNNLHFSLEGNYVASTGYAQIRAKEDNAFLFQLIHTDSFVDQVMSRCTGTSYPAINSTDLSGIDIYVPSLPEQRRIADALSAVDANIDLLIKKRENLARFKAGMMQKLFSQEIRFTREDGSAYPDWEEKELGDMATSKSSSRSVGSLEGQNGIYAIYGAVGIIARVSFYDVKDEHIGIVKDGAGAGRVMLCEPNSSVTGTMSSLSAKEGISVRYLYHYLNTIDFASYVTGSTIPHIYFRDYKSEVALHPWYDEQLRIASALDAIDQKIHSVDQKIHTIKAFKKGLLQQMFV